MFQEVKDSTGKHKWQRTNWCCPNCGVDGLWQDDTQDYYNGDRFACVHCERFYFAIQPWLKETYGDSAKDQALILRMIREVL